MERGKIAASCLLPCSIPGADSLGFPKPSRLWESVGYLLLYKAKCERQALLFFPPPSLLKNSLDVLGGGPTSPSIRWAGHIDENIDKGMGVDTESTEIVTPQAIKEAYTAMLMIHETHQASRLGQGFDFGLKVRG